MNIIGWNCRGMRKASAVHALLELQGRLKPDVLFLSKAHLSKVKAERLKIRLKFDNMLVSESDGRSGGLVLYWNNDLKVTSFEVSKNFIDIRINEHGADGWRLTGVYGEPSGDRKHLTWDCLRSLSAMINLPWMMLGDFNEILYGAEKDGGNQRPQRCMQAFRDALSFCNLHGFLG
jgi:exonuclease III